MDLNNLISTINTSTAALVAIYIEKSKALEKQRNIIKIVIELLSEHLRNLTIPEVTYKTG